jgi:small-conductance mechanosensitive channel
MGGIKRIWSDMNPTLRGFLIIALIAVTIVVLNLYTALASLYVIARIAFLLAIAFFLYLVWRERREEIATWPRYARIALYGGALLIVADVAAFSLVGASGMAAVAFLLVIGICGFAMFRVWREQRTYGY